MSFFSDFFTPIETAPAASTLHRFNSHIDSVYCFRNKQQRFKLLSVDEKNHRLQVNKQQVDQRISWPKTTVKILLVAIGSIFFVPWKACYRLRYKISYDPSVSDKPIPSPYQKPVTIELNKQIIQSHQKALEELKSRSHKPDFKQVAKTRVKDPDKSIATYEGLYDPQSFLQDEYSHSTSPHALAMRQLGKELTDKNYYYVPVRGGGNCFYLSYLAGMLFLFAQKEAEPSIADLPAKIQALAAGEVDVSTLLSVLNKISEAKQQGDHHLDAIHPLVQDSELIHKAAFDLRQLAVQLYRRKKEELNDSLHAYIRFGGNQELTKRLEKVDDAVLFDAYCDLVACDGENAQANEILQLGLQLVGHVECQASDKVERKGFDRDPKPNEITLWQGDNHFNLIIYNNPFTG